MNLSNLTLLGISLIMNFLLIDTSLARTVNSDGKIEYTITIDSEEEKCLLRDMISIQWWLDNAIHERARVSMDKIITESGDGSENTVIEKKKKIVKGLAFDTLAEKQAKKNNIRVRDVKGVKIEEQIGVGVDVDIIKSQ